MSYELIPKRLLVSRLAIFAFVTVTFAGLLYFYATNEEMFKHYRPYYLKSYLYVAEHHIATLVSKKKNSNEQKTARSIPVLVYHGMIPKPDNVSTSIEEFKNEMFALKSAGYQTIHIADFNAYNRGEKQLPDKSFLLTFDDGRKDSYYPVDPILKELDYSAVMFVITGTLDARTNNFHLTKGEFDKMRDSGRWDLQAHTDEGHGLIDIDGKGGKGHFYSNKLWLASENRLETDDEFRIRIRTDLTNAKQNMKKDFGIDAYAFAFPFNDYARDSLNFPGALAIFDEESKRTYDLLFYQAEPLKGFSTNLFGTHSQLISRINMETYWSASDFMGILAKAREKDLPINYDRFSSEQGWINTRGTLFFDKGLLNLNSEGQSSTATVLLDGTRSLTNYQLTTDANWNNTSVLSIIFNQRKNSDYYTASFFENSLRITTVVAGNEQKMLEKTIFLPPEITDHQIVFQQVANAINISIDNQAVLTNFAIPDSSPNGGIGLEVWNQIPNSAVATIKSLQVANIR